MLKNLKTGLIYRNPDSHRKNIHAYFPSVISMANGEMLASVVLGEAFEAANLHTYSARSTDKGETWNLEGPILKDTKERITSDFARITCFPDDEIIVLITRADRTDYPDEGLTNPVNLGFVPTDFLTIRSSDFGCTWSEPEVIDSPLGDIPLELCSPVTPLKDGRRFIPTSLWKKWDGSNPYGYRMVALVSHDSGRSWPEYVDVMVDPHQQHQFWESKIIELPDERLLATAWVYNHSKKCDLPNQFTLSENGGKHWTVPQSTGLMGQTLTPFLLDDGRILSVYRRMDKPGLWANVSRIEGDRWINEDTESLWGHLVEGLTATRENMTYNFNVLRFGAPCITKLPDETIFVAFWGYEDCVSNIRWFKFIIE